MSYKDLRARANSTQLKYRKWNKVIQPLTKYTANSSPLGCPITFTNQLQYCISKGIELKVNIPLTVSGAHDNVLKTQFSNSNQQIGIVSFSPNVPKQTYENQIDRQVLENIQRYIQIDFSLESKNHHFKECVREKHESTIFDQTLPFMVLKDKNSDTAENSSKMIRSTVFDTYSKLYLLNRDEFKKLNSIDSSQIAQEYIYPNSNYCSVTRFFYFPSKPTLSLAYKMDNYETFLKRKYTKSLWKIKESNEHSFAYTKVMHQNKSFTEQTVNIVKALEQAKKQRVEKIVCDWVIDSHNRYYLVEVKEVKTEERKRAFSISETINRDLSDVLSVITCCVCQQKFQNAEITKLVTHKLIWEFFEHLRKRKAELSFRSNSKHSSNNARVCDLCYMLVVSESKLIELEKVMARATNSVQMTQEEYQDSKLGLSQDLVTVPDGIQEYKEKHLCHLYAWRLFFYVEDLKELCLEDFSAGGTYFLMINLHNQIASFKLENVKSQQHVVKGIKISYLFSEQDRVDRFLNQSQITIRITSQNNWNSVIAEGSSNSLYEESEKFSMRKFKQILLFNSRSKYSVLGLHIGIKLDGNFDTEHLTLNKVHDAYLANEKYTNCLSIPPEWMEIMDPVYCLNKENTKKFQYEMNMTKKEIKGLLPSINLNSGKKKLIL